MSSEECCLFCEDIDDLEEHHIVPREYGGTDGEENLITVCSDCHKKIERTWDRRFYERIGVRVDMTPNMMLDALKEMQMTVSQIRAALGGAYKIYDKELEYASDSTVEDYGGTVTHRQVVAIKREAYRELLEDGFMGVDPMEELADVEEYSYRVLDEADGDDYD